MAPTQLLATVFNVTKRLYLEDEIDLNENTSRGDESSSEDSDSEFDPFDNEKLLAIICGSILGMFVVLGLVWLGVYIHRRRLGRRMQSPPFQQIKDTESRNESREDIEFGIAPAPIPVTLPTVPAPVR